MTTWQESKTGFEGFFFCFVLFCCCGQYGVAPNESSLINKTSTLIGHCSSPKLAFCFRSKNCLIFFFFWGGGKLELVDGAQLNVTCNKPWLPTWLPSHCLLWATYNSLTNDVLEERLTSKWPRGTPAIPLMAPHHAPAIHPVLSLSPPWNTALHEQKEAAGG